MCWGCQNSGHKGISCILPVSGTCQDHWCMLSHSFNYYDYIGMVVRLVKWIDVLLVELLPLIGNDIAKETWLTT